MSNARARPEAWDSGVSVDFEDYLDPPQKPTQQPLTVPLAAVALAVIELVHLR